MNRKNIIIISGPTATGKTSLSLKVAKKFGGEIVNFDSLLFYKELNIGTAKPSLEEQALVKHHLINTHSITSPINAAYYLKLAIPCIQDLHAQNKNVILVGGSGFYLQAVLNGMYDSPTTSTELLKRSQDLYDAEGINPFIEILKENDLQSFKKYHQNDHYRIRRAVEHFWMTGQSFFESRLKMPQRLENSPAKKLGWNVLFNYIDIPKEEHLKIIAQRTFDMINNGLIQEVEELLSLGYTGEEKPFASIGYKETIDYIKGHFATKEEYIDRLNINTRQLAKAQRTWFKKLEKKQYNSLTDKDIISKDISTFLNN